MQDKLTIRYQLYPMDFDDVQRGVETALQLVYCLEDMLDAIQDRAQRAKIDALLYGLGVQLEAMQRHVDATLAAANTGEGLQDA